MRIISKRISAKNGSGTLRLSADTSSDVWHIFNLLQTSPPDVVTMSTVRKVKQSSATGSVSSSKVRLTLTLRLAVAPLFDHEASTVRISGVNVAESQHVKMGSYHTFTLGVQEAVKIEKDCWDQLHLDRIAECTDVARTAELAGVVLQQTGLGHLCLIAEHMTVTKARVEVNIPRKRADAAWGDKAQKKGVARFFELLYQAVVNHVDFANVKVVLVGGPGFIAQDFFKYLCEEARRKDDRAVLDNKDKFVVVHASSGHKHSLDEALLDEGVRSQLLETKVARDVAVLDKFMRMLDTDADRAQYGAVHVRHACDQGAVETLLISDDIFRSAPTLQRRAHAALVEDVQAGGGSVATFSGMHLSGRTLGQLGGIAAILRFPVHEVHEESSSEEEEDPDSYFSYAVKEAAAAGGGGKGKGGGKAEAGYGDVMDKDAYVATEVEDDEERDLEMDREKMQQRIKDDMSDFGF
ncbi:hypothetical protein TeGR_g644 [Tetraparma gracilis]|uniref:Eukaryotic peptide chain release factor subunit 1 n=1 Tax=Tetraparma gracilis TaxID=2962635 RepID=A0ABQ6M5D2_9STRA|nr:hypothetical protein TeGR_g644 [Tetraparma gracilis]